MAVKQVSAALLADVKNNIDCTWADSALDQKIQGFIRSGMVYLDGKLGEEADYESDGYPRILLFEFVRYARDGAMDIFEANYKSMILAMQNQKAVKAYEEDAISSDQ